MNYLDKITMEKRIKELEIALSQQQKFNERILNSLVNMDKQNKRLIDLLETLTSRVKLLDKLMKNDGS